MSIKIPNSVLASSLVAFGLSSMVVACGETSSELATSESAFSGRCYEYLEYPDGTVLRDGNRYNYPDGSPVVGKRNGDWVMLYPNGNDLKDENGYFFFSNTQLMQAPNGDRVYYPNGTLMREFPANAGLGEANWYYPSGNPLLTNGIVRYDNGQIAASGSNFFAVDGSALTPDAFYLGHVTNSEPYKFDVAIDTMGSLFGPITPYFDSNYLEFQASYNVVAGLLPANPFNPRVSLIHTQSNYKPHTTVRWKFNNSEIELGLWSGGAPVTCNLKVTNP